LAMLFVRLHSQGEFISEIFWGVWLFPFGLLVYLRIPAANSGHLVDHCLLRLDRAQHYGAVLSPFLPSRVRLVTAGILRRNGNHALAPDQRRKGATSRSGS